MTEVQYTQKSINDRPYFERLHGDVVDDSPIIIALHWMTGSGTVMDFLFDEMQTPARLIFIEGQYPSGHEQGGYSWFPLKLDFYDKPETEQAPLIKAETDKLADIITQLKAQHNGKIIVTGMSQGGDLSLHLATYHPHLIDIAIPCAGRLSAPMQPKTITDTSPIIRIQQGADDAIVSVESAREVRDWLKNQGFDVDLDEYAGVGHDISSDIRTRIQTIIKSIE